MKPKTVLGLGIAAFLGLAVLCIWESAASLVAARAVSQPPTLRAAWGSSGVTLSGTVSDTDRARILAAAKKSFGAERVAADELRAAPRRPALFDLADLLSAAPRGLSEGVLEVDENSLKLSGSVPSEDSRSEVLETLRSIAGPSLRVVDDLVVSAAGAPASTPGPSVEPAQEPTAAATAGATSDLAASPSPRGAPKERAPAPRRAAPTADLQASIDAILDDRPLEFALGSARLTARSRRTLDQLVPLLKRNPRSHLMIASHTDAWGGTAHNRLLSQMRADAVVAHFVRKGIDRRRFTAVGYGETRPIAKGRSVADMVKNRRTEIRVKKGR